MRRVSVTRPSDGIGAPSPDAGKGGAQARIERARPQPGLVHDPEAVGEARVLGRREDPAGALQLADATQPLQPGRVEEVLLGDVLGGQPGRGRFSRRQPLGEFDVPVDRVADEVDCGEWVPPDRSGQGTQMRDWAVHAPTLPRRSVASHADRVVLAVGPVAQDERLAGGVVAEGPPGSGADAVLDVEVAEAGGVGLEARVVPVPRPAHVVTRTARSGDPGDRGRVVERLGHDRRTERPTVGRAIGQTEADVIEARAHQQGPVGGARHPHAVERPGGVDGPGRTGPADGLAVAIPLDVAVPELVVEIAADRCGS